MRNFRLHEWSTYASYYISTILSFIFTYVHFSTNPFFCRELIFSIGLSQIRILFCCVCKTSLEISLVNNDAIFSISHICIVGVFFSHYWKISCNIYMGCFIQKCEKIRIHPVFFPRLYKKDRYNLYLLKVTYGLWVRLFNRDTMGWFIVDVISNL